MAEERVEEVVEEGEVGLEAQHDRVQVHRNDAVGGGAAEVVVRHPSRREVPARLGGGGEARVDPSLGGGRQVFPVAFGPRVDARSPVPVEDVASRQLDGVLAAPHPPVVLDLEQRHCPPRQRRRGFASAVPLLLSSSVVVVVTRSSSKVKVEVVFEDGDDDFREEGRLAAVQVVEAAAVGHEAEGLDVAQQVVRDVDGGAPHPARQQTFDDPERVPVVHLAEAAARRHERVRRRQQRRRLEIRRLSRAAAELLPARVQVERPRSPLLADDGRQRRRLRDPIVGRPGLQLVVGARGEARANQRRHALARRLFFVGQGFERRQRPPWLHQQRQVHERLRVAKHLQPLHGVQQRALAIHEPQRRIHLRKRTAKGARSRAFVSASRLGEEELTRQYRGAGAAALGANVRACNEPRI
mmetsp:Transcript_2640/g.7940  ORF Transcript_2640/g.7940 Transcript_2640/m.7940 type:complete len:412 (+) Transcript_2640:849-2084(+)